MRRRLFADRLIWAVVFIGVCAVAWFTGQRIFYLTAAVLLALPVASYIIAAIALRFGVRVLRKMPHTVTKNAQEILAVAIHNRTPLPFANVRILISADENAVRVGEYEAFQVLPFARNRVEVPFAVEFRGYFKFGPLAVSVSDMTGLFRLKKFFCGADEIKSLPLVADISRLPLAANLTMQESASRNIRREDLLEVSDVRQYLPTDSIKRVHWKLTAKRGEWLVKNFQSSALNAVTIILDTARQSYAAEDTMVENALGLAKFCLNRGMPVNFIAGEKISVQKPGDFGTIYEAASELRFSETASCVAELSQALTAASGYVNAVIITATLTAALYEAVMKGKSGGHAICVMYLRTNEISDEDEKILSLLSESGAAAEIKGQVLGGAAPEPPQGDKPP